MKGKFDAILQPAQASYLDNLLPPSEGVLAEMEEYAAKNRVPIADREVARFLEITARAINARRVLEIGLAIGYGAAHLAQGMSDEGKVVTIELSTDIIPLAENFLKKLGLREKIEIIKGRALEVLPNLDSEFDLVYLDAVKEEYADYLDLCLPKLRIGGVVIVDNLLWSGRVAEKTTDSEPEKSTLALQKFNRMFVNHPQLKAEVLSVGDGLGYGVKTA